MTFEDAWQYLFGLIDYEKTPAYTATARYLNLNRMREALARAGNPHLGLRCVHIAGTKGKGSTAAMTAAMLRAAGYRVGLFTSPHLVSFRERIRVNDTLISEADVAALVEETQPLIESMRHTEDGAPTFFEAYTLLAFRWFSRQHVDVAVLETGMGGRLDATNVVNPLATAITTIALDHMAELGDTLAAIAGEKAGIIKPGVPVVSAPQHHDAAAVIRNTAHQQDAHLAMVGEDIRIEPGNNAAAMGERFTVIGQRDRYVDLSCPLLGAHQQVNAAVAIGLIESLQQSGMSIPTDAIRTGMASVVWPGRMQVLDTRPVLLLDGAHDPASIDALLAALDRHFPGRPRRFVLGFSRDKDWRQMLHQLAPSAEQLVLTASRSPRATNPEELLAVATTLAAPCTVMNDLASAIPTVLAQASSDDLVCVTGSLYIVGDALRWWQERSHG